jgi:hypothetical protein
VDPYTLPPGALNALRSVRAFLARVLRHTALDLDAHEGEAWVARLDRTIEEGISATLSSIETCEACREWGPPIAAALALAKRHLPGVRRPDPEARGELAWALVEIGEAIHHHETSDEPTPSGEPPWLGTAVMLLNDEEASAKQRTWAAVHRKVSRFGRSFGWTVPKNPAAFKKQVRRLAGPRLRETKGGRPRIEKPGQEP